MHQCFFYFHTGLIHRTEIFLANSARWTNPIFWKIFKCCTWLYAILWVANSWVIHPTADITYVFLHSHIVLIVICCKYTHYTSNDKAKRVKVLLIYNNYKSVCYLWETLLYKKLLCVLWVLWEAISRMWLRGHGRMPYPPILWGARCPVSSDRCQARRCRSYPRYNR